MRRFLLALTGLALLAAAVVIALQLYLPAPTRTATMGGAAMRVPMLIQQWASIGGRTGAITMPAELDGVQIANTEALQLRPQLAVEALAVAAASPPVALPDEGARAGLDDAVVVPLVPVEAAPGTPSSLASGIEQRLFRLQWPAFRLGGPSVIRLTFESLPGGGAAPVAAIEVTGSVATPILLTGRYVTHDALVVATLAAPAFRVTAATPEQQVMQPGQPVEWVWTLIPEEDGEQAVALSVTVNWQPKGGGILDSITIWNDTLMVQVGRIFGLAVPQAEIVGVAAAILGVVLEIPLLNRIFGFLWRRRQRRRRRERR
jgi:hypothetical protein